MFFKKYVFVLITINLIYVPVLAKDYTPETYHNHLKKKEKKLFWDIIEGYCPAEFESCNELKKEIKRSLKGAKKN